MTSWLIILEWTAKLVLVLLIGLSVWSGSIMIEKNRVFSFLERSDSFKKARNSIEQRKWNQLDGFTPETHGPKGAIIQAMLVIPPSDGSLIDRSVRSTLTLQRVELEKGLIVLATLGSNAPFIGLFGTVLGIIHAFGVLGLGQTVSGGSSFSVMQGVSEALVATAVGLLVAIPAVIAYNIFSRKLKVFVSECDSLKDLYISKRGTFPQS
jgi:biopolymer transport protein ExbB